MHARLGYTTMTGSPRRIVPARTTEAVTPTFTWWCFAAVRRIPSEKRPWSPRPGGPSRRRCAGGANYMGEPTAALWTPQSEEIQFNRRISLTRIEALTCLRGVTNSAPTIAVHRAVLRLSPQRGATSAGEGIVRTSASLRTLGSPSVTLDFGRFYRFGHVLCGTDRSMRVCDRRNATFRVCVSTQGRSGRGLLRV